ncbi:hypothetical protein [Lysobacter gummosus]|uniref:hypothetical protein n=1 Tax=Lysobacter gummosus TaxID=262324 RepID=UPI003626630B
MKRGRAGVGAGSRGRGARPGPAGSIRPVRAAAGLAAPPQSPPPPMPGPPSACSRIAAPQAGSGSGS